jgi:hypothetical protein
MVCRPLNRRAPRRPTRSTSLMRDVRYPGSAGFRCCGRHAESARPVASFERARVAYRAASAVRRLCGPVGRAHGRRARFPRRAIPSGSEHPLWQARGAGFLGAGDAARTGSRPVARLRHGRRRARTRRRAPGRPPAAVAPEHGRARLAPWRACAGRPRPLPYGLETHGGSARPDAIGGTHAPARTCRPRNARQAAGRDDGHTPVPAPRR